MESGSAEVSAPTTPAPTAQHILPTTDALDHSVKPSSKQRQRTRRACYPCSKRKIKCDRDERTPCSNCAKRPNAELCTFDDDRPRSARPRHSGATASPTPGNLSGDEVKHERTPPQAFLRGIQNAGTAYTMYGDERKVVLQPNNDPPRSTGTLDPKPPHLHKHGASITRYSVVPEALPTPPPGAHHGHNNSFVSVNHTAQLPIIGGQLPLPGLASIAAPPPETPADELRALLPTTKHVTKYCDIYRNTCHALSPVDVGIPHMEEIQFQFIHNSLEDRLITNIETKPAKDFKDDLIRVALLCAGIAAGIQICDLDDVTRRSMLRRYVANAMKLLRIANAQASASIAAYPVLLIIARVMQDEAEPLLSWSVLGSVKRMAQIYTMSGVWTDQYPAESRHLREGDNLTRVRQRQESFLALVLGQSLSLERLPFPDTRSWSNASFLQCLDVFAAIAAYCGSENIDREDLLIQHADAMQAIPPLEKFAMPHLSDKSNCRNMHEMTEYCTLRLYERLVSIHYCQIIMAACRRLPGHEDEYFRTGEVCQGKTRECVDTYLDMLAFSILPLRSWILTVTALRAALILGVLLAESPHSVSDIAPDQDRLSRLLNAFLNVQDETTTDRARWVRRYPVVFQRLQNMCELSGKHSDGRSAATNGVSELKAEQGTALQWMTRDDKDDIMMPNRMVRAYLSTPSMEDGSAGSLLSSSQVLFDV